VRQLFVPNFRGEGAKLIFAGSLPEGTPNIVQKIVSKTSSYIVCFNFYVQQFKIFILAGAVLVGSPPKGLRGKYLKISKN